MISLRSCICSTSYQNIHNIDYDNNDQDILSLISQSQLRNSSSLHSLSNNSLRLYHQNINKTDELICSLSPISPHRRCLTGHHLQDPELDCILFMHYDLATKFCQHSLKSRRISIFFYETLLYTNTNLNAFCKEQDIEVCYVSHLQIFVYYLLTDLQLGTLYIF